ncbi:MAG: shikimate dehydrogenase [Anaerolineae bacterium]|jgi:shikimate dehydrogenase|nr:shikimate dehydrogenase [Anaerolineae bacterium]
MNRVGVIGYPIAHSLSPVMHNAAFKHLGMDDWQYDAMEIPPDILRLGIREPRQHGYIGLNVTLPFKQAVMQHCRPDDIARAVGAVNTLDFRDDTGTNTDVAGLIEDLQAYGVPLAGATVLVLGAGGVARAAVYGLWQQGAQVIVVNRTRDKAQSMLAQLTISAGVQGVRLLTLDEAAEAGASLIVNCTSVGMTPHVTETPWIHGVPFPAGVTVYDMVYRPAQTRLMQQAEAAGGRAIGGLGMLARQGAAAFTLWTGRAAPVAVMLAAAQAALHERDQPH